MKTIRTKVYQFSELSDSAKQKAIEWYRTGSDDGQIYADEIIDSVKELAKIFNLEFGREYTDIRTSHIDDNILELQGVRLYKYIVNNYSHHLFRPKYIKSIDRAVYWNQFICKRKKGTNGDYTQLYSKWRKDNSCVLTGVCYDMDILNPVYEFLARPDKTTTFADLISDIESAIQKTFDSNETYVNSDSYVIESIEANEYDFTADGKRFNQ
jgi:hypothetical protein